jgi:peptidoglycan pentaglycine glycine transferase (the first glycine)
MQVSVCTDRTRFNEAVSASPLADVLQSWEWGDVKATAGWRPLRLLLTDDTGASHGACSVLLRAPVRAAPPIAYAPRGPVIDFTNRDALTAMLTAVRRHAGSAFAFKCDPPIEKSSAEARALLDAGLRSTASGPFGGVQPIAVMVLDLSAGADSVFAGFKSKWRYNVRLAERKGVTVREGTASDIATWYGILVETARRDGFVVRARSYFETLWRVLEPAGMLKMFVAEFEGSMIAGILCTAMGGRVVYNFGASSNEHRNVMPNHLIQWHAIRWAADKGYRVYDFRGVSPIRDGEPVEEHIAGLNRFKEGFGATYVEYAGEFDLPLRRAWYAAWDRGLPLALKVRRALRGQPPQEAGD